jgi:hypothetical protein
MLPETFELTATMVQIRITKNSEFFTSGRTEMLVKLSSKNQVTVPRKILARMPATQYLDVEWKDGVIVMKPVTVVDTNLEQIRDKMKKLGLKEDSVAEAIQWARSK